MASWVAIAEGVFRFEDSCNVYAVEGPEGMLVVDAGTGAWLLSVGASVRWDIRRGTCVALVLGALLLPAVRCLRPPWSPLVRSDAGGECAPATP
ncbi:MAG: hypothetical protein LH654_04865 [Thermoleophilia bacterium]|nr:hypothetical protein [Thermoleophilia bacterium]